MPLKIFNNTQKGNLPGFITIGAWKCGTTSLHYYLNLHPQISMSREKELNFFSYNRVWEKGIKWYKSNFTGQGMIHGETSPSYTAYPFLKGVPERIHSLVPDIKLIYCLRDPVNRIISHYLQNYTRGIENRKIEEALTPTDRNIYICSSKYHMQIDRYLKYFKKSDILIITLEELYDQRQLTLRKIFKFLNVDASFYSDEFQKIKHKSIDKRRKNRAGLFLQWLAEMDVAKIFSADLRRKIGKVLYLPFSSRVEQPVLDEYFRERLINCLKDDINRLREYTGREFKEWCV